MLINNITLIGESFEIECTSIPVTLFVY